MKALVIGGSSGLGLAIARKLIEESYFVEIIGRSAPPAGALQEGAYAMHRCDLSYLDEELISSFAADPELSVLMITAGFGRIADFAFFHTAEIEKMMTVNATSVIRILRLFYDRTPPVPSDPKHLPYLLLMFRYSAPHRFCLQLFPLSG